MQIEATCEKCKKKVIIKIDYGKSINQMIKEQHGRECKCKKRGVQ